ncbi:MAG: hypothetical protein IKZ87_00770 [Actinomycetaceae bacterium]|nr:hypothetical protein [Actinomycetaceae bacterium]
MAKASSGFENLRGRSHWSNCAIPAKFFGINSAAALPWIGFILHISWFMLGLAFATSIVLIYIERKKRMTISAVMRSFVVFLGGKKKIPLNYIHTLKRFLY